MEKRRRKKKFSPLLFLCVAIATDVTHSILAGTWGKSDWVEGGFYIYFR